MPFAKNPMHQSPDQWEKQQAARSIAMDRYRAHMQNRRWNDPDVGRIFHSISDLFAGDSGERATLDQMTKARATKEEADRRSFLFSQAQDETVPWSTLDRLSFGTGLQHGSQTLEAVDRNNATARYGHDTQAATSRANNAADNERALQQTGLTNANAVTLKMLDPVAEGATRFVPPSLAGLYGVPDQQNGNIATQPGERIVTADGRTIDGAPKPLSETEMIAAITQGLPIEQQRAIALNKGALELSQGETAVLPDGSRVDGAPKPLSATEWQAQQNERLRQSGAIDDQMLIDIVTGGDTPVQAVGPDGAPRFMSPGAAVRTGARPYDRGPSTVINTGSNGVAYGEPEKGLSWARNPDGTIRLDDRGAPIALPYQGGSVYEEQRRSEAAAAGKNRMAGTKGNIVVEDIDRALERIMASPTLTTGVGSQIMSSVGGTPAYDVQALIDTIRANIGFDQLQAMRDASPTGGALGQVTERELQFLQALLGNIQPGQSAGQLKQNLERLRGAYTDVVDGAEKPELTDRPQAAAGSAGDLPRAVNPETGERLVYRNGQWERE